MVRVYSTGLLVMRWAVSSIGLPRVPLTSKVKVCFSPRFCGEIARLMMSTLACPVLATTSTPSTATSLAPRARPAAAAGEPGSTKARRMLRGGELRTAAVSMP
ncbi:hypothetical protein D3C72_1553690 [compost metagenome]